MFYYILLSSFFFSGLATGVILLLTKPQELKMKEEIRYGSIGALWFGFISWCCVYLAQYKPFVDPELNRT